MTSNGVKMIDVKIRRLYSLNKIIFLSDERGSFMLGQIRQFISSLFLFISAATASEKFELLEDVSKTNIAKLPLPEVLIVGDRLPKVLIVGGGLGGLAVAKSLQKIGCTQIDLIEKKSTFRDEGTGIALPANASWALDKLGIDFKDQAYPIDEMIFTNDKAEILCQEDLRDIHVAGSQFYSIDRSSLHRILLNSLSSVTVKMNTTVHMFKENTENITVTFSDKT